MGLTSMPYRTARMLALAWCHRYSLGNATRGATHALPRGAAPRCRASNVDAPSASRLAFVNCAEYRLTNRRKCRY
ncbi:MAG: hypothetical protein KatS3mg111_3195 [Pirellulaceae bacterium]|nr:MAG: hypothetical protein KatS3mg111_3195 [Pirellulaceae bacterium]